MNTLGRMPNAIISPHSLQTPLLKRAGANIQFVGKQIKSVQHTKSSNFCGVAVFKSIRVGCASVITIPLLLLDFTYKLVTAPFRWAAHIIAGKNQSKEPKGCSPNETVETGFPGKNQSKESRCCR